MCEERFTDASVVLLSSNALSTTTAMRQGLEIFICRLLEKISEATRAKIDPSAFAQGQARLEAYLASALERVD